MNGSLLTPFVDLIKIQGGAALQRKSTLTSTYEVDFRPQGVIWQFPAAPNQRVILLRGRWKGFGIFIESNKKVDIGVGVQGSACGRLFFIETSDASRPVEALSMIFYARGNLTGAYCINNWTRTTIFRSSWVVEGSKKKVCPNLSETLGVSWDT